MNINPKFKSVVHKRLARWARGKVYHGIRQTLLDKNLREYCKRCCSVVNLENDRLRNALTDSCGGWQA